MLTIQNKRRDRGGGDGRKLKKGEQRQREQNPVTTYRKNRFLEGVELKGTMSGAALYTDGKASTVKSYLSRAEIDPQFAADIKAAQQRFAESIVNEAYRRAVEGSEQVIIRKGRVLRDENGNPVLHRSYSDRLMMKLLSGIRHNVAGLSFQEPKQIHVSGNIEHNHNAALAGEFTSGDGIILRQVDIAALQSADRLKLIEVLRVIAANRNQELLIAPEHAEVIESDFSEVPDADDDSEPEAEESL